MLMPSLFGEDFFDNLFDDFTRPVRSAAKGHGFANMPQVLPQVQTPSMRTDIQETAEGYEFDVELPGYAKDDITAELKDGYLTITAKKESAVDESGDQGEEAVVDAKKYIRRERYYGTCRRAFYVGEDVTQNDIKAKYDNGILQLFVPKVEPAKVEEEKKFINIEG